ncbi:hypothetical protein D3C81_1182410 [compost metagenome]
MDRRTARGRHAAGKQRLRQHLPGQLLPRRPAQERPARPAAVRPELPPPGRRHRLRLPRPPRREPDRQAGAHAHAQPRHRAGSHHHAPAAQRDRGQDRAAARARRQLSAHRLPDLVRDRLPQREVRAVAYRPLGLRRLGQLCAAGRVRQPQPPDEDQEPGPAHQLGHAAGQPHALGRRRVPGPAPARPDRQPDRQRPGQGRPLPVGALRRG